MSCRLIRSYLKEQFNGIVFIVTGTLEVSHSSLYATTLAELALASDWSRFDAVNSSGLENGTVALKCHFNLSILRVIQIKCKIQGEIQQINANQCTVDVNPVNNQYDCSLLLPNLKFNNVFLGVFFHQLFSFLACVMCLYYTLHALCL